MPRRNHISRAKRRQAVYQTMNPRPVFPAVRQVTRVTALRAKFKKSQGPSVHKPLLSLIPQLIIAAININGLTPETEWGVSSLLEGQHYDVSVVLFVLYLYFLPQVLCLSETHCRLESPTTFAPPSGYEIIEATRGGTAKQGGGLLLLYKSGLDAHPWIPTVSPDKAYIASERQWLLIHGEGGRKLAVLNCYLACQRQDSDSFLAWNKDLYSLMIAECQVLKSKRYQLLAIGDFNAKVGRIPGLAGNTLDHNRNAPLFQNFISMVGLFILNTLPTAKGLFTRFMSDSSDSSHRSVLDYGLTTVDHVSTVKSFIIDKDARHSVLSDHALLTATLTFGHIPSLTWSRQVQPGYNLEDEKALARYGHLLDRVMSETPMATFDQLPASVMLETITTSIHCAAKKELASRAPLKRKGRRLPSHILSQVRLRAQKTLQRCQLPADSSLERSCLTSEIDDLKIQIDSAIGEFRLSRRTRLRSHLVLRDKCKRRFWRFLQVQSLQAGRISALQQDGVLHFDQPHIEEGVLNHFSQVFKGSTCPPPNSSSSTSPSPEELAPILSKCPFRPPTAFEDVVCAPFTLSLLQEQLSSLKDKRACGVDGVKNELLKHTNLTFQQYLMSFLNRVLYTGEVPPVLSLGRCVLLPKGGDASMPAQYRPIVISSVVLKLLTSQLCKRMTQVVEDEGFLGKEQFGFRQGRSTVDAIFTLTTLFRQARVSQKRFAACFVDISKVLFLVLT